MLEQKIIDFLKEHTEKPYLESELMSALSIDPIDRSNFIATLESLAEEGKLIRTKKGKHALPEFFNMCAGRIQITTRGFGFVTVDGTDGTEDVFVPAVATKGAFSGDRVLIKCLPSKGGGQKKEGEVVSIIERAFSKIVGTYEENKGFGFVVPDDKKVRSDFFVSKNDTLGAKQGDKVVLEVTKWAEGRRNPEGKIIEVLGSFGEPGVDILSVMRQFDLSDDFPGKVMKQAEKISTEVEADELQRREDFRNYTVITIDGKDAKDLDDAIHVISLENGHYELGVHIADVTHYVKEGSALDKEALKRGTSVYLLNRVIPMLPKRLSNGICSLNPAIDRLTLSCIMEIDETGTVCAHRIVESVIKTVERMNYDDVSDILEDTADEALKNRYAHLIEPIKEMRKLAAILEAKREQRGAIDFDFAETKIELDGDGKPIWIGKADRRVAHRLIESFMLAANETVAEHVFWMELPFVYRVHEDPSPEKIETLNKFLYHFGYKVHTGGESFHPTEIQKLLESVEGKKEEHVISKMALRSLKQARYAADNVGHFGLAAKYYCHFTSPIRRYPDLQIHRILREIINGSMSAERIAHYRSIVGEVSEQSSERERNAELAEREVDDMKMAEYMVQFVGDTFKGVISSVTSFGMFIELDNTVEGLVRLEDMDDDYYIFDESRLQLVGERLKKTYSLGDEVEIRVTRADPKLRQIDFELA
ncbi:MAG: ribonuclease [Clostridiales bacterium]|nr:ribonuclease [Clostridiales bacterium]